jgi:Uma2 family endonuclease
MTTLIASRAARLSDVEFLAAVEAGVFGDRRVFLWGGRLFEKMAKTKAHAFVAFRIAKLVSAVLPAGWDVWHENPIRLDEKNVPLPDLAVLRGPDDRYRDERPQPADVGLIVEVAVTSRAKDLGPQAAKYARAGVACYWVADVAHRRIIEHRGPRVEEGIASYEIVRDLVPGDQIDVILDGTVVGRVAVSDLF